MGSDTTIDGARIDQTTRAQSFIESGHHEIHANRAMTVEAANVGVAATQTLTLAANAGEGETVTIDTKQYTFRGAVGVLDGSIHISHVDASGTIDNLIAAINGAAGAGTDYGIGMTLHTSCYATAGAGDTMIATAKSAGVPGNALASTEAMAQGDWADTTLDGGVEPDRILVLAFKTPDTTMRCHLVAEWLSQDKAHFEVYEGRTWTTSTGSQVSVLNRRRDGSVTTTVLEDTTGAFADNNAIVKNPTTLAAGTLLHADYTLSNKDGNVRSNTMDEIVLKGNSTYSFELTSDVGPKAGYIRLRWYEVADAA